MGFDPGFEMSRTTTLCQTVSTRTCQSLIDWMTRPRKTLCYLNETICQKTLATCAENLCCCLRDGIKCDLKKSAQAMDELAAPYVPVRKDVSLTQIGDLERQ